jgi:hypothetical protein
MSRNNLAVSEKQLIPSPTAGKKAVRAVHAVMMRWVVDELSPDEILSEKPKTVQEFCAQQYLRAVQDATPGSKVKLDAVKQLRTLIDGNDEPANGMIVPVTYVKRVSEDSEGKQTFEQEVHQEVRFALRGENDGR